MKILALVNTATPGVGRAICVAIGRGGQVSSYRKAGEGGFPLLKVLQMRLGGTSEEQQRCS